MNKRIIKTAKQVLPRPVQRAIKGALLKYREHTTHVYDKKRFQRYRFRGVDYATQSQLEGKLIYHAHAIEKGLSHDQIRLGFGKAALKGLSAALRMYELKGYDKNRDIFKNALSVLKAYIGLHEDRGYDIEYLDPLLGHFVEDARTCSDDSGGAMVITKESKENNQTKNFKELFSTRYSVRTYSEEEVDISKIRSAISLALKAPSVCNRQSGRVHILTDQTLIGRVLHQQGGIGGYPTPPILLVVTTDTSMFLSLEERNQIYTDGGLLSMALLLCLEYEGLAACPLNAMLPVKKEKAIRRYASLPENENIVMFISVGNFKQNNNVPKSFRLKQSNITTEL